MSKCFADQRCKAPCKAEKCQKTLITQADIGSGNRFLISRPGLYCLCSDINFSIGIAIEIAASNVTLDLCQHTISGSESGQIAVLIRENEDLVENVVVRNGKVVNLAPNDVEGVFGAALSFYNCSNITIETINANKGTRGLIVGKTTNLQVYDCKMSNMSRAAAFAFDSEDLRFERCHGSLSEGFLEFNNQLGEITGAACKKIQIHNCSCNDIARSGAAFFEGASEITLSGFDCTNVFHAVNITGLAETTKTNAIIRNLNGKNVSQGVRLVSVSELSLQNCKIENSLQTSIIVANSRNIVLSDLDIVNVNKELGAFAIALTNTDSVALSNVDIVRSVVGVIVENSTNFTAKNAQVLNSGAGFLVGTLENEQIVKYVLLQDCRAVNCDAFGFAILRNEQTHLEQCIANSSEEGDPRLLDFNYGIFLSQCSCCLVKQCKANFNTFGFAETLSLDENAFIGNCAFANVTNYSFGGKNTFQTIATAQSAFDNVEFVKDSKRALVMNNANRAAEERVRSVSSKAIAMLNEANVSANSN